MIHPKKIISTLSKFVHPKNYTALPKKIISTLCTPANLVKQSLLPSQPFCSPLNQSGKYPIL